MELHTAESGEREPQVELMLVLEELVVGLLDLSQEQFRRLLIAREHPSVVILKSGQIVGGFAYFSTPLSPVVGVSLPGAGRLNAGESTIKVPNITIG